MLITEENNSFMKITGENSHITHPKGLGLCVSKECS